MKNEEAEKMLDDMKSKLKAVQDILDDFRQIDKSDLKARAEAMKKAVRLQQEVAQEIDDFDSMYLR
ncbi:MAG: hypothetical protein IKH44_14360 [Bacteroidales bacterium]|nr:hypothetical protein [Bacteroidales bacterium]